MMVQMELDIRDAFDHLFLIGLASIVESETGARSFIHWRNWKTACLETGGVDSEKELAASVLDHARRAAESRWLTTTCSLSVGKRSPLSPRIGKLASREQFQELEEARRELIDSIGRDDRLTRRLIGALGRPSDWSLNRSGEINPDAGASAWDMKTRNRGEEFIQNRLAILGRAVASRTTDGVVKGLLGTSVVDEAGSNALTSRTPTGLRSPGVTDNARAWCALWGLSTLPTVPVVAGRGEAASRTAGAVRGPGGDVWFYLAIIQQSTTVAAFRAIARSEALARQAAWASGLDPSRLNRSDSRWLAEHGLTSFVVFHRSKSDNQNAPESWAESGRVVPIAEGARGRVPATKNRSSNGPVVV